MATTKKTTSQKKSPKTTTKKASVKKTVKKTPEKEVKVKTEKFCEYCGSNISEQAEVCPNCGKYTSLHKEKETKKVGNTNTKIFNVLSYLGILWIVGMLSDHKDDKDVKFHIGQGMLVTIVYFAVALVNNLIIANVFVTKVDYWYYTYKTTSSLGIFLMWILWLVPTVLSIIGIINAARGEEKELPVIGKYAFYK
ncbi:MAG TPA: hypothetical protein PLX66_01040 [Bacilli bacterium]|nr:hypothetical protein [Bacilli bacterium]